MIFIQILWCCFVLCVGVVSMAAVGAFIITVVAASFRCIFMGKKWSWDLGEAEEEALRLAKKAERDESFAETMAIMDSNILWMREMRNSLFQSRIDEGIAGIRQAEDFRRTFLQCKRAGYVSKSKYKKVKKVIKRLILENTTNIQNAKVILAD